MIIFFFKPIIFLLILPYIHHTPITHQVTMIPMTYVLNSYIFLLIAILNGGVATTFTFIGVEDKKLTPILTLVCDAVCDGV